MNNKEKKTNKKVAILCYLISLCFNIVAIINSLKIDNNSTTFLCLGSVFLCLGSVYLNKD